jgi:hypothetical protein
MSNDKKELSESEKQLIKENFLRGQLQHVKSYQWKCDECEMKWFIRIDERIPEQMAKLEKFDTQISLHVLKKGHHVEKKQKFEKSWRRV